MLTERRYKVFGLGQSAFGGYQNELFLDYFSRNSRIDTKGFLSAFGVIRGQTASPAGLSSSLDACHL